MQTKSLFLAALAWAVAVSMQAQSQLSLEMTPKITVTGSPGEYQVQWAQVLDGATNWVLHYNQSTTIVDMNIHKNWFRSDPNNLLPWPEPRVASSLGNDAHVSLVATPGHAGIASAQIGIQWDWDLAGRSWDEVKNRLVVVSIDYTYRFEAHWTMWTGSGNAWLYGAPEKGWSDWFGFETGEQGVQGLRTNYTFTSTLAELGNILSLTVNCQAHATANRTEINSSQADLTIHSISINFPNLKVEIVESRKIEESPGNPCKVEFNSDTQEPELVCSWGLFTIKVTIDGVIVIEPMTVAVETSSGLDSAWKPVLNASQRINADHTIQVKAPIFNTLPMQLFHANVKF